MCKILREQTETPEELYVKYDGNFERHKILSNWSDEFTGKFKKAIIDGIAAVGVSEDEAVKNYSELCEIFGSWMQGKTTEYDPRAFTRLKFDSISPQKGFYIMGAKGTGKTTFMVAFRNAIRKFVKQFDYQGFKKVTGFDIKNEFAAYGVRKTGYEGFEGGIEKYFKPYHKETGREYEVLYVDDFLFEDESGSTSYYGNSSKVAEDVIKARMDNGLLTFITSNFGPDSFSEPVVDRIRESMNIIVIFSDESFRE